MSTANSQQVLIVGAGPVGLSMAIELRRRGVDCRIIDADDGPTPMHESRAMGIQARTMEVFRGMGVADEVIGRGRKLVGASAHNEGRRVAHLTFDFDGLDTRYPEVLSLPQSATERILIARLDALGGSVERRSKLVGFSQDAEGVRATLEVGGAPAAEARCGWLVGCDGSRSVVRKALGLSFEGGEYPERFLIADVRIAWGDLRPDDREIHFFLTPEGPIVSFPFPDPSRWRLVDTTGIVPGETQDAILSRFTQLIHDHVDARAVLDDPSWTSSFVIHRRVVGKYRSGRCFVAGDAAHLHSPAGGQGMNTGIQDAVNLAWKLALVVQGKAPEGLLASYTPERKAAVAGVLKGSDLATRLVTLRGELARHLRDKLMSALGELDFVRKKLSRGMSELAISYLGSPIVAEDRRGAIRAALGGGPEDPGVRDALAFAAGPGPGDRAPDVAMAEGRWLSDALDPTGHTLLAFAGTQGAAIEHLDDAASLVKSWYPGLIRTVLVARDAGTGSWQGDRLADPDGEVHRRYGASAECLYLIRPDGYIGYRSQPADASALARYLGSIFAPAAVT